MRPETDRRGHADVDSVPDAAPEALFTIVTRPRMSDNARPFGGPSAPERTTQNLEKDKYGF